MAKKINQEVLKQGFRNFTELFKDFSWGTLCVITFFVMYVIVNPAIVWLWCIIAPQDAAWRMYSPRAGGPFNGIFFSNQWLYYILPWNAKKELMYWRKPEKCSSKDRISYFLEVDKRYFKDLSAEEKNEIFITHKDLRQDLIDRGMKMSVEQFNLLGDREKYLYIKKDDRFEILARFISSRNPYLGDFLKERTPSWNIIQMLVQWNSEHFPWILRTHGCPNNRVNELRSLSKDPAKVDQALADYGQIQIVKNADLEDFKLFCEEEQEISYYAQVWLDDEKYQIFHQTGHTLTDRAIQVLLSTHGEDFAELIFRNEPEFGVANEVTKAIVNNSPNLRLKLAKIKRGK